LISRRRYRLPSEFAANAGLLDHRRLRRKLEGLAFVPEGESLSLQQSVVDFARADVDLYAPISPG
jgi:hypothetical protein